MQEISILPRVNSRLPVRKMKSTGVAKELRTGRSVNLSPPAILAFTRKLLEPSSKAV